MDTAFKLIGHILSAFWPYYARRPRLSITIPSHVPGSEEGSIIAIVISNPSNHTIQVRDIHIQAYDAEKGQWDRLPKDPQITANLPLVIEPGQFKELYASLRTTLRANVLGTFQIVAYTHEGIKFKSKKMKYRVSQTTHK